MLNVLNKIKSYGLLVLAGLTALLAALFLYEKRKNEVNDAILGERETDKILSKTDAEITSNNEVLKQQEADRTKLEKEKSNEVDDKTIIDKFNKFK